MIRRDRGDVGKQLLPIVERAFFIVKKLGTARFQVDQDKAVVTGLYLKIIQICILVPGLGGSNASENFLVQCQGATQSFGRI